MTYKAHHHLAPVFLGPHILFEVIVPQACHGFRSLHLVMIWNAWPQPVSLEKSYPSNTQTFSMVFLYPPPSEALPPSIFLEHLHVALYWDHLLAGFSSSLDDHTLCLSIPSA